MAHWAKPDYLNLILDPHGEKKRRHFHKLLSDLQMHTVACTYEQIHTYILVNNVKILII